MDNKTYTAVPICPWCGTEDGLWWDAGSLRWDGDTDVFTCGRCDKEYNVTFHVTVSFTTTKYEQNN